MVNEDFLNKQGIPLKRHSPLQDTDLDDFSEEEEEISEEFTD